MRRFSLAHICYILAAIISCLAASTAKIPANYVRDGSFESIPASHSNKYNFQAGNWTFANRATLLTNAEAHGGEKTTPFGKQYVQFGNTKPYQTNASVTQQLSGLLVNKKLLLTYSTRQWQPPTDNVCDFNVTLGSQQLDYQRIVSESSGQVSWTTRALAIRPESSGGPLRFSLYCPRGAQNFYQIHLDNITIGGLD